MYCYVFNLFSVAAVWWSCADSVDKLRMFLLLF